MNWLLICGIGILVVCALEGYFRGFIKIVFSLLAMIITLAVVSVAAPKITTYIEDFKRTPGGSDEVVYADIAG